MRKFDERDNAFLEIIQVASLIQKAHENPPTEITFKAVDSLVDDVLFISNMVADLEKVCTELNKVIMNLQGKAGNYLKVLGRDEYTSPNGKIETKGKWRVSLPQTDEDKMIFFEYLKAQKLFDRFATVNSNSLNAYYMREWEAAKRKDPEAAITFSMPGVPSPVFNEFTQIKPAKVEKEEPNE